MNHDGGSGAGSISIANDDLAEPEKLQRELGRLRDLLREAEARAAKFEKLADLDPLVPLLNRRAFMRELSRFLAGRQRYGHDGVLLYADVNGFKEINDRFGHNTGDQVLKEIADLLAANVRSSDIVGRIGGDEFAVLLSHTCAGMSAGVIGRLKAAVLKAPIQACMGGLSVSITIGVCDLAGVSAAEEAVNEADRSMYQSRINRPRIMQ